MDREEKNKYYRNLAKENGTFNVKKVNEIIPTWTKEKKAEYTKKLKDESLKNQVLWKRKHLKKEVELLLDKQIEFNPSLKGLKDEIIETIFRQRDFEVSSGPKDPEKYNEWKQKLTSKGSREFYHGTFVEQIGKCSFFKDEDRVSNFSIENDISFILSETSKLLLKIFNKENERINEIEKIKKITREIFEEYFTNLKFNKKIIENILEKNGEILPKLDGVSFAEKSLFIVKFNKIDYNKKFVEENLKLIDLNDLSSIKNNNLNKVGNILSTTKTPARLDKSLKKLDSFFNDSKYPMEWIKRNKEWIGKNKTLSTSSKFIFIALDKQMNEGIFRSNYEAEMKKFNFENELKLNKNIPFQGLGDKDMERNKVVFRSISQVRQIVKRLLNLYGNFDKIIVEVASDLYAEKDLRKIIRSDQDESEKNNKKIIEEIENLGFAASPKNIEKLKLFRSQSFGKNKNKSKVALDLLDINLKSEIKIENLFDENFYQVDHIVPYSLLNDNTISNKILTNREFNQAKLQRTPIEYFKSIGCNDKQINAWIVKIIEKFNDEELKTNKVKSLLTENFNRSSERDFETRNINDTRYITKYINAYFEKEFALREKDFGLKMPQLLTVKGGITSKYRKLWLNNDDLEENSFWGDTKKPRSISNFHHAVDAMILINMFSKQKIEFYNTIVRIFDWYNYLRNPKNSIALNSQEIITSEDRKNSLIKQKENIKTQIQESYFISKENKILFYEAINTIYFKIFSLISKNNDWRNWPILDLSSDKFVKNSIKPLVDNLPLKINNLIPVKLKQGEEKITKSKFDKNLNEWKKEEQIIKVPVFDRLVEVKEWSKLNGKNESQFPYVSYKIEKSLRGNFLKSENIISYKNANDINGNLKNNEGFIKDKNKNIWDIRVYQGFKFNDNGKLIPINKYNAQKKKIGVDIGKNIIFEYKGIIYKYNQKKATNLVVSHPNLVENPRDTKETKEKIILGYKDKFNVSPFLSFENITKEKVKILNINFLGKIN